MSSIMDFIKRKKEQHKAETEVETEAPPAEVVQDTVEVAPLPVRGSSNVRWAAHDNELGILFVGFDNDWYSYDDPEAELFNGLLDAESAGKFVNKNLRPMTTRKWQAEIEPLQGEGYPFAMLEWSIKELEERIAVTIEANADDDKVNWEESHLALPGNSPEEFMIEVAEWISEMGDPHCDLSIGEKKNLAWIGNVEYYAVLVSDDAEAIESAEPEEEPEEEPAEETQEEKPVAKATSGKGKNPRRMRRLEGRDWDNYLSALMICAAKFMDSVGVEPAVFLPHDAPEEVAEILLEAGFTIHHGNDLPSVGTVGVGVVQEE